MGGDGSYLLGNGASIPSWYWFSMVCWIDLGYFKGFGPRAKCDRTGDCCLCYFESSLEVSNVFVHSTSWFSVSFNWYKFVDRSKVDYQKQIDDMRFMIERAFSTAYKKS